jgi:hypothetical protein
MQWAATADLEPSERAVYRHHGLAPVATICHPLAGVGASTRMGWGKSGLRDRTLISWGLMHSGLGSRAPSL